MTNKAELAARLTAININPPENWGKLSLARATVFVENSEAPAKPKRKTLAETLGANAGAVLGAASAPVARSGQTKAATMPKDLKWKRQGENRLRKGQWLVARVAPVVLETASRQVLRALKRREDKMPLGANQSVWHRAQGFGTIGGRV